MFRIFGNSSILHFLSPATKAITGTSSLLKLIINTRVLTIAPTGTFSELAAS